MFIHPRDSENFKMINKLFSENSYEKCGEISSQDTYTNVVNEQLMQNIHDPEFLIKHQGLCSMKPDGYENKITTLHMRSKMMAGASKIRGLSCL